MFVNYFYRTKIKVSSMSIFELQVANQRFESYWKWKSIHMQLIIRLWNWNWKFLRYSILIIWSKILEEACEILGGAEYHKYKDKRGFKHFQFQFFEVCRETLEYLSKPELLNNFSPPTFGFYNYNFYNKIKWWKRFSNK